jgi:two-component system, LytTR family, response regulator
MKIKAIIIDDEARSRETMFELLRIYCPQVEVVGEASDVSSGLDAITKLAPDLVFLDIKMPDGTGFDLIRQIKEVDFALVFITAYEEYAVKAFKFNAIDYLLKPIDPEELVHAVERCGANRENDSFNDKISHFLEYLSHVNRNSYGKKIILKTFENVYVVDIKDVVSIESDMNYCRFNLINGESILVSRTMKEFEEMLDEHHFYRIHQSYIVNLSYIKMYSKEENTCLMTDGSKIPVSYRKKDELFTLFKNL